LLSLAGGCVAPLRLGLDRQIGIRVTPQHRNCGAFTVPRLKRMKVVDQEGKAASSCVREAIDNRAPFFMAIRGATYDAGLATGLIGGVDGNTWVFWYDTNPCGGPQCSESFTMTRCNLTLKEEGIDPVHDCEAQ